MSEPAEELWHLDDLIATIVAKIQSDGRPASEVIDDMRPRLNPRDSWIATRAGLIYLANDKNGGMRSFRSGHFQTARSGPKPAAEESAGLDEFAERILSRLIYHGADGAMRSVLDFDQERLAEKHPDRRAGWHDATARVIAAKAWSGDLLMEWKERVPLEEFVESPRESDHAAGDPSTVAA